MMLILGTKLHHDVDSLKWCIWHIWWVKDWLRWNPIALLACLACSKFLSQLDMMDGLWTYPASLVGFLTAVVMHISARPPEVYQIQQAKAVMTADIGTWFKNRHTLSWNDSWWVDEHIQNTSWRYHLQSGWWFLPYQNWTGRFRAPWHCHSSWMGEVASWVQGNLLCPLNIWQNILFQLLSVWQCRPVWMHPLHYGTLPSHDDLDVMLGSSNQPHGW